ncbi:MAG: response regulator transcription factor [Eubacteriales bacterium]
MIKILVVEDDVMLNSGLCYNLELDGYTVVSTKSVSSALAELKSNSFDLAVLDINLPDGDGFCLCEKIKQVSNIPVIFLSARDLEEDILNGFDLGADDYVTKPFNINILLKKIAVAIKRSASSTKKSVYSSEGLEIDFEKLTASMNDESIVFTPTEYKILKIFTANTDILLTRQSLLEKLYDIDANFVDEHTLTVNVNRLRGKIEKDNLKFIKTVYGMGYIWTGGKL